MKVRLPAVAGTFYPADKTELTAAIGSAYMHRLGPGRLPPLGGDEEPKGVFAFLCPHAGYIYSGPVAAHSYLQLSEMQPDLVIIAGPNHHGLGRSAVATYGEGAWQTPLGSVPVDDRASKRLTELTELVSVDDPAHRMEHSIEVQLPFLQNLYGNSFKFLPIMLALQDEETARDLGRAISDLAKEEIKKGRKVAIIASSDLTHYEPMVQARDKDKALLARVMGLDLGGFYSVLREKDVSACGFGAIGSVMKACIGLGLQKGELNAYSTSGDVTGETDSVVGYPSVSFVK